RPRGSAWQAEDTPRPPRAATFGSRQWLRYRRGDFPMATAQPPAPPVPARIRGLALLALCFFLSGATGLVYQTVWMRMLGLVFGHTVLATTTVLVAFMAGLALGSWLLARRAPRLGNLIAAYGWLEVGIGVYCALLSLLLSAAAAIYL